MKTISTERIWISWRTRDPNVINRIRQRFNIPNYMTINKLSPAEIESKDMPLLEETARRGFISVIREKWCKKGDVYAFTSRK